MAEKKKEILVAKTYCIYCIIKQLTIINKRRKKNDLYAKANDQFELEGKSLIGLLPMLTCRLRYSGTGKPRVIPPIKMLDETFECG